MTHLIDKDKLVAEIKKCYNECLKRAKITDYDYWNGKADAYRNVLAILDDFPELKESEDERIREAQLDYWRSVGGKEWHGVPVQETIAWLEKQGDTNETINNNEFTQGVLRGAAINLITWIDYNAAEGNMCLSNIECKDIEDALVSGDWNKIYAYIKKKLEKQGEKPQGKTALKAIHEEKVDNANKVEPKFKVGEFVINSYDFIMKVVDIKEESYWYIVIGGNEEKILNCTFRKMEESCHLWDISDAKDGDVLVWDDSKCIALFKNIYDKDSFSSHGFVGHCTSAFDSRLAYHDIKGAHPATKEQRDLLFQKMHEAGYEFDDEKKELKKMEDKNYNGEDYGIDSLFHAQRILEKTLGKVEGYQSDDGILEHKCAISAVKKLFGKKSTKWNDEDEENFRDIIGAIHRVAYQTSEDEEARIKWLKSLKQRMGKK